MQQWESPYLGLPFSSIAPPPLQKCGQITMGKFTGFYLVSLSLVQFPYICSYQEANYTIVVLEKSTSNNFEEGPFEYVDRDEQHVRIEIQDGLRPNWNYTATVIVETVAGSINSSIYFSKHP